MFGPGRGGRDPGDTGNVQDSGRGHRADSRGGRGGGHGGPQQASPKRKLGDDKHTQGPTIFNPPGQHESPDVKVEAKENQIVKENQDLSLSTLSLADFQLPLRPGHGVTGTAINLRTNYFRMTVDAKKKLCKYTLTLTARYKERKQTVPTIPPERSRKRRQALALLFQRPEFRGAGHGVATDYGTIIITSKELPVAEDGTKEYEVVYREAEDQEPAMNPIIYTFKLSYRGIVPTTELLRYLASTSTDPSDFAGKDDAIQALNIIIARTPNFNPGVYQSGNNKFFQYPTDPTTYDSLENGLIAVRGYYSSVRTSTLRTLLNVNCQTSAFYPAINVLPLMREYGRNDPLSLESFLHLLRVKTKYMKHKDGTEAVRVKTIVGLWQKWDVILDGNDKAVVKKDARGDPQEQERRDFDAKPRNAREVTCKCKEFGDQVFTIEEYFKKKHNITLVVPEAWLLNCGTRKDPVWIPPELCEVMPGQAFRGKLSDYQTTQMIKVAARRPGENARRIANGAHEVIGFQGNNPSLAAFGVRVDSKMVLIKGRVLPAPPVTLMNQATGKKYTVTPARASWNLMGKKSAKPVTVTNWSFLRLDGARLEKSDMNDFREALRNCGLGTQDPLNPQGFQARPSGSEDQRDTAVRNVFDTMSRAKVKIVLVILPTDSALTFNRVKYWGDVKAGIHTVCVLTKNLSKGLQYHTNVALKFNLKLGGVNQLLPSQLGFLNQGSTMVVGIDVSHPPPKSMVGTPSIAAVVASIDDEYGQWPGSVRCQNEPKQEMLSTLRLMMEERLRLWVKKNKKGPAKILIYRDGVSEGQYKIVLEVELKQIREACQEIYGCNTLPQITIVVVGKRHHTRFYPTASNAADNNGNPLNGTVVDRGVTMERGYDFFLQAHTALQGTAKPSHYVVILDEMKLGAEELQTITHHLCYGFGRATKAVSVCPPAFYADILAERGRRYLDKYVNGRGSLGKEFDFGKAPWIANVHSDLMESMFYI